MMTKERAYELRAILEKAAQGLEDQEASMAPSFFPRLKEDGSLVKAGTKINWQGRVKRAAVDLWDREENTPDQAPTLWEDITYRDGFRLIPAVITPGLAFGMDEKGWWEDQLYRSLQDANVTTPQQNPAGWAAISTPNL